MQTTSIFFVLVGIIFQFFGVTIQLADNYRQASQTQRPQEELFRETQPVIAVETQSQAVITEDLNEN